MLLQLQNPLLGWQCLQTYIWHCFRQANPKPPLKLYHNLIFEKDKLLTNNFNLISLLVTHLRSLCGVISTTQPGCMAYWQALCSKGTALSAPCPVTGPSRPLVPISESPEHLLKMQIWGPHPRCTKSELGGEESLGSVF